jgi:hypothetical protein
MFVIAQDTILKHEPPQFEPRSIICPLLQIALHFPGILSCYGGFHAHGPVGSRCRGTVAQNGAFLNPTLGYNSSRRFLDNGLCLVILGDILRELALFVASKGVGAVHQQDLEQRSIPFPGTFVK